MITWSFLSAQKSRVWCRFWTTMNVMPGWYPISIFTQAFRTALNSWLNTYNKHKTHIHCSFRFVIQQLRQKGTWADKEENWHLWCRNNSTQSRFWCGELACKVITWRSYFVHNAPVSLCRIRTNWQFKFVQVIIPGHSSNDNDNQFEQCSSRPCSFGWSVRMCTSTNTFHSWLCALKTCSYLLCRTAYVLYSSHSYCIPGCSNCILCHLYMTVRLGQTRRQCKIRRMELECARDCCKVDICINSCSQSC